MNTLESIRKQWEKNMTPLYVAENKENGCICVVLKNGYDGTSMGRRNQTEENPFNCHRYVKLGDEWYVSVDGQSVSLEAVFSWLTNPTALSAVDSGPEYNAPV